VLKARAPVAIATAMGAPRPAGWLNRIGQDEQDFQG